MMEKSIVRVCVVVDRRATKRKNKKIMDVVSFLKKCSNVLAVDIFDIFES